MASSRVVYDTCVLVPAPLRDLLLRVAEAGLVRAGMSDDILDELERRQEYSPFEGPLRALPRKFTERLFCEVGAPRGLTAGRAIEAERAAWAYVGPRDARPAPPAQAERTFTQMTGDLRSRFRHELVRNVDGDVDQRDAPEVKARRDEGEGLCVVSFVVAAKRTLADLDGIADPQRFRQALRVLRSLSVSELVALEVIWSPAEDSDRMSSAELEVLYGEMHPIAAEPMGRAACTHCGYLRPRARPVPELRRAPAGVALKQALPPGSACFVGLDAPKVRVFG